MLCELEHAHVSPLDDHPHLSVDDVLRYVRRQPREPDGVTPSLYCGEVADRVWGDATVRRPEWYLHGRNNGVSVRDHTTYKYSMTS